MARLREGRANTARGAACVNGGAGGYAGARGQLTARADSGFYAHSVVVCRKMDVRPSAAQKMSSSHTRRGLDADSLLDGRRRL